MPDPHTISPAGVQTTADAPHHTTEALFAPQQAADNLIATPQPKDSTDELLPASDKGQAVPDATEHSRQSGTPPPAPTSVEDKPDLPDAEPPEAPPNLPAVPPAAPLPTDGSADPAAPSSPPSARATGIAEKSSGGASDTSKAAKSGESDDAEGVTGGDAEVPGVERLDISAAEEDVVTPTRKSSRRTSARTAAAQLLPLPVRALRARAPPKVGAESAGGADRGDGAASRERATTQEENGGEVGTVEGREGKEGREEGGGRGRAEVGDVPKPYMGENGLRMDVGEAVFVTMDQLAEQKQKRMRDKKLKGIEALTFQDVHSYNRDQLRCYCYIYSTPRRKKVEMEADMARFVSYWNEGRPGYVLSEYVPKDGRPLVIPSTPPPSTTPPKASEPASAPAQKTPAGKVGRNSRSCEPRPSKADASSSKSGEEDVVMKDEPRAAVPPKTASKSPANTLLKGPPRAGGKSPAAANPKKAFPGVSSKGPARSASRGAGKTLAPNASVAGKRLPPRPQAPVNIQPFTSKPVLSSRPPSAERPLQAASLRNTPTIPIAAGSSGSISLPRMSPSMQTSSGASTPVRSNSHGGSKSTRPMMPIQPMPQGYNTSFKQKVHARAAGSKFKAAYNGAGPAIVNIVENAAAYFEGRDAPEVVKDQAKSYERYQFNVDLLTEIFDGPPPEADKGQATDGEADADGNVWSREAKEQIAKDIAKCMRQRVEHDPDEARILQERYAKLEAETKAFERRNVRLFQRLERAETEEQVAAVKREYERANDVDLDDSPVLKRRMLDKSLPPLIMVDDEASNILRFKVA